MKFSYLLPLIIYLCFFERKLFFLNIQNKSSPNLTKVWSEINDKKIKLSYDLDSDQVSFKLFDGEIKGPECIIKDNNTFYTGLLDGRIISFELDKNILDSKSKKKVSFKLIGRSTINGTNEYCNNKVYNHKICGRPLSLQIVGRELYVLDANYGLFSINLNTKIRKEYDLKKLLIDSKYLNEEKSKNLIFNYFKFDHSNENLLYITISTTKWNFHQLSWSIIENENSGFIAAIDLKTKNAAIVAENLYFPNGVEIDKKNKVLYFSQSTDYSIYKMDLDLIRRKLYLNDTEPLVEPFIRDLPGEPDNINIYGKNIYVTFIHFRKMEFFLGDFFSQNIIIKYIFTQIILVFKSITDFITIFFKNDLLKKFSYDVYSGNFIYYYVNFKGAVGLINVETGKLSKIIASNKFGMFSHALYDEEYNILLLGSYMNDFIQLVKLDEI